MQRKSCLPSPVCYVYAEHILELKAVGLNFWRHLKEANTDHKLDMSGVSAFGRVSCPISGNHESQPNVNPAFVSDVCPASAFSEVTPKL